MYFDLSQEKFLVLGLATLVLAVAVGITFNIKEYFFGSTPFFPATGIFLSSIVDNARYGIGSTGRQLAGVFSALSGSHEVTSSRDARAIPVLTYHRITEWHGSASGEETSGAGEGANVSLPTFRDQMEALKAAGWQTITIEEFTAFIHGEGTLPEKSFLLTFDDGAKDSFYPVDPILRSLGYNAVSYLIVTGTERQESTYYLSEAEVSRMLDTGRWEIGSHTYDAHHLVQIAADGTSGPPIANRIWNTAENRLETIAEYRTRLEREFLGSKNALERTYGVPVTTFAFPFGDTGEESVNVTDAEAIVLAEAKKQYDFAFVQNDREHYTFNYPDEGFLMHRVHVDPSWSGADLVATLEDGLPKDVPYTNDLSHDAGWIISWGNGTTDDGLTLTSEKPSTSASAILDGTRLWSTYQVTAKVSWQSSYVMVLVSASDARTYRSCAYEDGEVRLQQTVAGNTVTLADAKDTRIATGTHTLGARVTNSSVTCLYDGRSVLTETGLAARAGGIGFQTWNPIPGAASMHVTDLSVQTL